MELIVTFIHGYTSITPDNPCLQISQNVLNNLNIEIDLSEHIDDLCEVEYEDGGYSNTVLLPGKIIRDIFGTGIEGIIPHTIIQL